MKFIKITLIILASLLLLVVLAAGIFVATFDANDYRPQISEQVKRYTGREFELQDIQPSVFPWVGMELQQMSLGNAKGFDDKDMVKIERLDVKVELLPLLRQQIHIDTLRIHGLELSLAKNKAGVSNWDDIVQKQSAEAQPEVEEKKAPEEEGKAADPLAALLVNGIEIKDANIRWQDAQQGQSASLKQFNLVTGSFQVGELLPISLTTQVALSEPATRFDIDLQTEVDINPDNQVVNVPDLVLQVLAEGEVIPQGKMQIEVNSSANLDLNRDRAEIPKLTLKALGLTTELNAVVTELQAAPKLNGHMKLNSFDATQLVSKLGIELPAMKNPQALQQVSLALSFNADQNTASIKPIQLSLDKSNLTGEASVSEFASPDIRYSLALDTIDVDDYLPPPAEAPAESEANVAPAASEDVVIELPVEMIRGLNVMGDFSVAQMKVAGHEMDTLKLVTDIRQGVANVPHLSANLLEGSVNATAKLDVTKDTPQYAMQLDARGLNADSVVTPILQDLLGKPEVGMNGAADVNVDVTSHGNSVKQLIAGSNGQLKLDVGKATLRGIDTMYFVKTAVADYMQGKNLAVPERMHKEYQPEEKTALKTVRASAQVNSGVVSNRDLLVDSSRFKVTGAGTVDLPKENIDYRLVVDLQPPQTTETWEKLLDVPLPVKVKGSFAQPRIDIERSTWVKNLAKAEVEEKKREVKQKVEKKVEEKKQQLEQKVEDKVKDKLKGLFGR